MKEKETKVERVQRKINEILIEENVQMMPIIQLTDIDMLKEMEDKTTESDVKED